MNYIKHLAGFFNQVATDDRLNPTHISMYVSLFQFWNASRFQNPISISRSELMKVSKISAKATYHKCMKDLHNFGYLRYQPSYNPFKGSLVYLFNLQSGEIEKAEPRGLFNNKTGSEQPSTTHPAKNHTGNEQAREPYINTSKHTKPNTVNNKDEQAQKPAVQKADKFEKKEKSCAKKERNDFIAPELSQVEEYFVFQRFPLVEAQKFHNYFQSNGWLIGGKAQMKDWKAAARNWMLNAKKFAGDIPEKPKAKQLHATTDKNYSEPL